MLKCGLRVNNDAAVAAHRNRERDQLACLWLEVLRLRSGLAKGAVAAECVRAEAADLGEGREDPPVIVVPVEHHATRLRVTVRRGLIRFTYRACHRLGRCKTAAP